MSYEAMTTQEAAKPEGWAWPGLARKAHYFRKSRSLCGKWLFTGVFVRNQDSSQGSDDCVACFRKREKERVA